MPDTASSNTGTVDVLRYDTDDGVTYKAVESGRGEAVVLAHVEAVQKRRFLHLTFLLLLLAVAIGVGVHVDEPLLGVLVATVVGGGGIYRLPDGEQSIPTVVEQNVQAHTAAKGYDVENR